MENFVILSDGKVPRQMAEKYGRELNLNERLKNKVFGVGFFKPIEGQSNALSQWFEQNSSTTRPHLDQLTHGLIFRLAGTKEMDALGITYSEITKIRIKKLPDIVNAIPLTLFWLLIKVGFEPRTVRWFTRYGFYFGDCEVTIELENQNPIGLTWKGRHEKAIRKFFSSKFLKEKLENITN